LHILQPPVGFERLNGYRKFDGWQYLIQKTQNKIIID
jgi:hypothetical protein